MSVHFDDEHGDIVAEAVADGIIDGFGMQRIADEVDGAVANGLGVRADAVLGEEPAFGISRVRETVGVKGKDIAAAERRFSYRELGGGEDAERWPRGLQVLETVVRPKKHWWLMAGVDVCKGAAVDIDNAEEKRREDLVTGPAGDRDIGARDHLDGRHILRDERAQRVLRHGRIHRRGKPLARDIADEDGELLWTEHDDIVV